MLPGAPSCGSKVFTFYVKPRESFYVLRKTHPKVFTFYVKFAQSFCRSARGASLARRARRGAIDLAFARRPASAGLGLGTRLCPFHVKPAESFYVLRKNCDTAAMNTIFSAAMILFIFGMVIYLTKDL